MNTFDILGARAASMEAGKNVHETWNKHMSEADIFELVQSFQIGLEKANEKLTVAGVQEQVLQNIRDPDADDPEGDVFEQDWLMDHPIADEPQGPPAPDLSLTRISGTATIRLNVESEDNPA